MLILVRDSARRSQVWPYEYLLTYIQKDLGQDLLY